MLAAQLQAINEYPLLAGFQVIIVDDCSPEPAAEIVKPSPGIQLYRIEDNIPWNREGARNLGATVADTKWIVQIDIDHVLPPECAWKLVERNYDDSHWYLFRRFRVGKADDTRRKDTIPDDQEYGPIKPHMDSYFCTKDAYWKAGGYNEDYSGCLGGGGQFLKMMRMVSGEPKLLPEDMYLEVYTRDRVADASVSDLSRDKSEFKRRKKLIGLRKAENPLRFKWKRIW
jgi:glycosyltransferase involved in cell wall biosynthesis